MDTLSSDEDSVRNPPYRGRKYYFRQLGYQPKMLRMKVAHMFLWHMAYGQFNPPLKRETLEEMENVELDDDADKQDGEAEKADDVESQMEVVDEASLPPIPIRIEKAGEKSLEEGAGTQLEGGDVEALLTMCGTGIVLCVESFR